MHVKIANTQCVAMALALPLVGPWTATVQSDGAAVLSGRASLTIADSLSFSGTVKTSAPYSGRVQTYLVAGAGGMQETVEGKAYSRATVRLVVVDLLSVIGESLSPTSDAMTTELRHWMRARNPARR